MQYNLEAFNLLKKLTPPSIKMPLWKELLSVIAVPLDSVNMLFTGLVEKTKFELKYNGQVICIEELLNFIFPGQLPIFITDNIDEMPINYLYLASENSNDNIYIYPSAYILGVPTPVYLYTEYEHASLDDFFVYVPQTTYNQIQAAGDLPRFKSIINKRKIAGKKYSIIVY